MYFDCGTPGFRPAHPATVTINPLDYSSFVFLASICSTEAEEARGVNVPGRKVVQLQPFKNTMGETPQREEPNKIDLSFWITSSERRVNHLDKLNWGGFIACKININPYVYKGTIWFSHFKGFSQTWRNGSLSHTSKLIMPD